MMGSVATIRQSRQRRFARASVVQDALALLAVMVDAGKDLLIRGTSTEAPIGRPSRRTAEQRRELLPLPLPDVSASSVFGNQWPSRCYAVLDKLVVASALSLNCLYTGKYAELARVLRNTSQRSVAHSLMDRWLRLARHMSSDGFACVLDKEAFHSIVDKGAVAAAVA